MIIIPTTTPLNSPVGAVNPLFFQRFQTFISAYERTYVASTLKELVEVKSLGTNSIGHASLTPPT